MTTFKLRGINRDLDVCQCCGKQGLKKVVWLDRLEQGEMVETVAYGANCAARALRMGAVATWSTAQRADAERARAELLRVHEVGAERSVNTLVVEAVGQNGGQMTLLAYANGLRSAVETWAEARWPHLITTVRWAR